jgi:pilus assembly protein FimV
MEAADAAQPPAPLAETVAPVETPTEAASDSLLPKPLATMLEQNLVPVAAGGAALLGLAGWLAIRRRRKPEAGSPLVAEAATAGVAGTAAAVAAPAAAAAAEADEAPAVDAPQVGADVLADLPDSTFLDDFSPEDINALQDETGEVDPVSEADVYIAYGRYQQAEELLRQALSRDPDRLALKHKLLEVHYATRDAVAFAALAQEMVDGGQDAADQAAWMRAQDMGRELAPDNPMFVLEEAGQGAELAGLAGSATATTATAAVGDEILSLDDAELSELTAAYEKEEVTDTESFEAPSEISITLDDLDAPAEQALASVAADEVAAAEDLPASISLDELETVDFELPEVEKDDAAASDVEEETSDSFDIENMMAEAEAAVDAEDSVLNLDSDFSAEELQAQLDELSDLSVLDSGEGKAEEGKSAEPSGSLGLVEADTGFVEDELDQPLNLDTAFDEEEPERQSADVIELKDAAATSGAGDEDDVTTKLDLARAYVEMGDEDGARSILEEVVAEGNDSQRGDAKRLLTKIG